MSTTININNNVLTWAIARAGYDISMFTIKNPHVQKWLDGEKTPTFKQLEDFSRKVYLPFGYLFLNEPPKESLPIPYFRSNGDKIDKVSVNIYDTILLIQQRQSWLRDYLLENDFEKLTFVGRYKNIFDVNAIVNNIRDTLKLEEDWANGFNKFEDVINYLVDVVEDKGIITVFNGVVENSNKRKLSVDECRGFVLVDEIAPFMFINNADFKSAQMFTIVHELAHIWTGHSAGFDFRRLQPADDPIEKLCDQIAAEFLVPQKTFNVIWDNNPNVSYVAKRFKVSEIVIARRALDTGKWTKSDFFDFYDEYRKREFEKKDKLGSGGDFFATTRKRLSVTYAQHVKNAVKSNQLLYRDACRLTSLKGDTFEKFFSLHI